MNLFFCFIVGLSIGKYRASKYMILQYFFSKALHSLCNETEPKHRDVLVNNYLKIRVNKMSDMKENFLI
jgi:hypothetical protein